MTQSPVEPTRCPVCGASNSCAAAAGSSEPCWCMAVEISQQALERIPEAARNIACLCPRCAAFAAEPRASVEEKS